jgi:hypothetical protein
MDQGLDGQIKAHEEENSIGPADEHSEFPVDAPIQETAVNVKGV